MLAAGFHQPLAAAVRTRSQILAWKIEHEIRSVPANPVSLLPYLSSVRASPQRWDYRGYKVEQTPFIISLKFRFQVIETRIQSPHRIPITCPKAWTGDQTLVSSKHLPKSSY